MDIHLVSIGEKSNPKPNPIGFGVANPKIMREKSSPDPNPKSTDMQLESEPLSSFMKAYAVTEGPTADRPRHKIVLLLRIHAGQWCFLGSVSVQKFKFDQIYIFKYIYYKIYSITNLMALICIMNIIFLYNFN